MVEIKLTITQALTAKIHEYKQEYARDPKVIVLTERQYHELRYEWNGGPSLIENIREFYGVPVVVEGEVIDLSKPLTIKLGSILPRKKYDKIDFTERRKGEKVCED